MVVVDTSVWVDYFRGAETRGVAVLDKLILSRAAALTDVVYGELLQGAKDAGDAALLGRRLAPYPILRLETLADFALAAELYRRARDGGRAIRHGVDCLIAAVCIRTDSLLLHADADFDRLASVTELRAFG